MTNREALIKSLECSDIDEYTVDYLDCVNSDECKYDGKDTTPCTECKMKWLEQEAEI